MLYGVFVKKHFVRMGHAEMIWTLYRVSNYRCFGRFRHVSRRRIHLEQLKEQVRILDRIIKKLERGLETDKRRNDSGKSNNEGTLKNERMSLRHSKRKNNNFQYYLINKNGHRTYIKKKEMDKARKLAQREYDEDVLNIAKTQMYRATQFLKLYDFSALEKTYANLSDAKKPLVEPVIMPIDQYICEWRKAHPGEQNSFPYEEEITTNRGEIVRSKSEKIIADLFNKYDVPYVCEPEVRLFNGKCAYPDFVILNKRTRKTS